MTSCTQPGCTGTIVDGYCDVCGSPGPVAGSPTATGSPAAAASTVTAPAAPSPVAPPSSLAAAVGNGAACTQPGCTGTIVDGYCDVCGTPGAAVQSSDDHEPLSGGPVTAGGALSAGGAGSTITRGSSRLGSTALGSSRAAASGSKITRRVHSGSQRLRSARLGAGLTRVPPAPEIDAAQAIMKDPQIPEEKRFCPNCGAPVGRSPRRPAGSTGGLLRQVRQPLLLHPQAQGG